MPEALLHTHIIEMGFGLRSGKFGACYRYKVNCKNSLDGGRT